ncbi:MAG: SUMF1/EgtB/PvdO family nonheme iron enzyme [Chloroflexi bacterium]|nr:SUMF1/EgtB/PvdO family nonheme iron enzyme [Chloroflexota bacterium]MBP8055844.1 SUMF1/EgtB/PvdO family nonheme iron enzyme [Chloroflexota bacterium]
MPHRSSPSGAQQVSPADGALLVYVPAGVFYMGMPEDNPFADMDEHPQRTITLGAFWLDRTEVTNGMYERCVQAGACSPIVTPRPDYLTAPNYPVQGVIWPNAAAYCAWVGRRLPTEAEWEKAARGTDGRLYPWGDTSPEQLQVNVNFRVGDVAPVGTHADDISPYGALDMGGNVLEWVADWYEKGYDAAATNNPSGPATGAQKVLRGGSWNAQPTNARTTNRFYAFPTRNDFDGFRCALSVTTFLDKLTPHE